MKDFDLNNLDINNIGSWPVAVRALLIVIVCIAVLAAGYFLDTKKELKHLDQARRKEVSLKREFEKKEAKAANLDAYRQQMKEMKASFGSMLRQLPSKTEVESLLVDISQTGLASGVQFDLFKPQPEKPVEFYAEQPIQIVVTGTYHEFGKFVSGVAALPRIVTLENIDITAGKGKGGKLRMSLLAKTYRYLDANELAAQRKAKSKRRRRR
ncbi:MAG TPA: type 4a pilus biogenesis protein PilO [Gammaproteobacteria bacterium]|nr:type 4a pilus biogenesis protein PilO [Gammaproteobacteria bacterium]